MAHFWNSFSKSKGKVVVNLLLLLLVGAALWFFYTNQSIPGLTKQAAPNATTASTDPDIAAIQAQLELERTRAEITREQIRIRQLLTKQTTATQKTAPTATPETELDRDEQKQRIAEMIEAQFKGNEQRKRQLNNALQQKERELAAVKTDKLQLQNQIEALDDSTQSLLAALLPGQDISASDQNYLLALQGDTDNRSENNRSGQTANVDLINRIEISDSQDAGSITAQLRNRINQLMKEDSQAPQKTVQSNTDLQSGDLQSNIDDLFNNRETRKVERVTEKQFLADSQYLESLDPIKQERSNETRWVTVREGDTLSKIAMRVYGNTGLYTKIYAANPQILSNPDLIRTGQRLRVPN